VLDCQKADFFLPPGTHYLNCAYMSPTSRQVEEAGLAGLRAKRYPADITPDDFFSGPDLVRRRFAELTNATNPDDVAILASVSYGMALVARNVPFRSGQNVVVVTEQFPSNVYVWRRVSQDHAVELRTVGPGRPSDEGVHEQNRALAWNDAIVQSIDRNTALVAIPNVHWADGTLFDLARIREACDAVAALLVVDGTQSVGALDFDVQVIRPDALICAGYKWLFGPYGLAVAWFGERLLDGRPLEENWIGRAGSEDFSGLVRYVDDYQPGALRYDVGERSNFILIPMMAAALEQVKGWGADEVQRYCAALSAGTIDRLRERGYRIADEPERAAHLFGIRLPRGLGVDTVRAAAEEQRISVSFRGDAIRVSPHVYNDAADLDALENALTGVLSEAL
jgi:selenocysteine lyase/cysteine desulfurase